jgi:hypothetical protein
MTVSKAAAIALGVALTASAGVELWAESAVMTLRATVVGEQTPPQTLRIELLRWSTDTERAPLLAAAAPPAAPPAAAPAAAPAAGAAAGGRGGRAGGGARGRGGANAPASPLARLTTAVKAAPTVGFIWGDGVTGYSIKYAWRAQQPDGGERIVLVTDRRLGVHSPSWPTAPPSPRGAAPAPAADPLAEAEFTVIEMRIDGTGAGEGKTSLTSRVAVDAAAQTVTIDAFATAPVLLKVVR